MIIIGSDMLMIATGIFAACLDRSTFIRSKLVWFVLSCMFYMIMLVTLHYDVAYGTARDQPDEIQELFHHLEVLTVVVWSMYPIVVFLGRAHFHIISRSSEDACLCVLDCC